MKYTVPKDGSIRVEGPNGFVMKFPNRGQAILIRNALNDAWDHKPNRQEVPVEPPNDAVETS